MKLRRVIVKGKIIRVPDSWKISHSVLIEPKGKEPYFTILMTDEEERKHRQLEPAIGLTIERDEDEE